MTVLCHRILLVLLAIMMLSGCASAPEKAPPPIQPQPPPSAGEPLLAKGITSYEEGQYSSAAKSLQAALNAGLQLKSDKAKAHKYLAFIACSSDNTKRCQDEFRKAFEADPTFALDPAEAGHPVWGPIYRQVRDQIKSKKKTP